MAIDFELTEEQALVCGTVEQFAKSELRPAMRDFEAAGEVPEALRRTFLELGLERLPLPEAVGGLGADDRMAVLVNERLAYGDPGASMALSGWESAALALEELSPAEQAQALLEEALPEPNRPSWAAVALSEPPAGWRSSGLLATRAERSGDAWILNGRKVFVRRAAGASLTLVAAQELDREGGDGLAVFAVEGAPEGLSVQPMAGDTGLLAAPMCQIELDAVQVPDSHRLRSEGDVVSGLRRFLARAAVHNAARCVGLMRACWEYARDYASERVAFGKPVAHFQAIAFMLADMATLTDASRWSVWQAAYQFDTGGKTALRDAAAAAINASEAALKVSEDGVQILGGAGYVEDYPAEKWMRDARALTLGYGTPDSWLNALGHDVMGSHSDAPVDELLPLPPVQPVFT